MPIKLRCESNLGVKEAQVFINWY